MAQQLIHRIKQELDKKTDVFLSHDWGVDQKNHKLVSKINEKLKSKGLRTWFDEEKMEGNIRDKMTAGIDHAQCVLVFVTKNYMQKVGGNNSADNCKLEFGYSSRRKTAAKMIPIVMEANMRNAHSWTGELGMVLGGSLYIDMVDNSQLEENIDYQRILNLLDDHQRIEDILSSIQLNKIVSILSPRHQNNANNNNDTTNNTNNTTTIDYWHRYFTTSIASTSLSFSEENLLFYSQILASHDVRTTMKLKKRLLVQKEFLFSIGFNKEDSDVFSNFLFNPTINHNSNNSNNNSNSQSKIMKKGEGEEEEEELLLSLPIIPTATAAGDDDDEEDGKEDAMTKKVSTAIKPKPLLLFAMTMAGGTGTTATGAASSVNIINPFESYSATKEISDLYYKAAYLQSHDALQRLMTRSKEGYNLASALLIRIYFLGQGEIKASLENAQAFSRRLVLWLKDKSTPPKKNTSNSSSSSSQQAQHIEPVNIIAKFIQGFCFEHGLGRKVDLDQAKQFYLLSAQGLPSLQPSQSSATASGPPVNSNATIATDGYHIAQQYLGVCYEYGYCGMKIDYNEAVRWYHASADNVHCPNIAAQYNLGRCYKHGRGVEVNQSLAFHYYRLSAEQGNLQAQVNLALCYKYGYDMIASLPADNGDSSPASEPHQQPNYSEMLRWLSNAAEKGNALAQYNLAVCYDHGDGVDRDMETAVTWYKLSAEQGNPDAQYLTGHIFRNGFDSDNDEHRPNLRESARWLKLAAEQGHAEAQCMLGVCYKNGESVNIDYIEAIRLFKLSAAQNNSAAQCLLGKMLEYGCGVAKNIEAALRWYKLSGQNGNKVAQNILGCIYKNGNIVTKDLSLAVKYFSLSAEQGYEGAINNLGLCYIHGQGIVQDVNKALELFDKAAQLGNPVAKYNLGICHEYGDGLQKNLEKARILLKESADGGYEEAREALDRLERKEAIQAAATQDAVF